MEKPEPTEHQVDLFYWMSIRLMAAKYMYYVTPEFAPLMSDESYDNQEKSWYKFGRELGFLDEDETSPCIDFDWNHPMAADAKILGDYYNRRCKTNPEVEDLFKRYKQE